MKTPRLAVLSIVPSPYQRDLFAAMAERPEFDLHVYYCEAASPDSPWPSKAPAPYETILPSFYLSLRGKRFIVSRDLPRLDAVDLLVLNGYMTWAAQRLARRAAARGIPTLFWGEKMLADFRGLKGPLQRFLAQPLADARGIVAIGKGAEEDYRERYPAKPVYELPYYCSIAAFQDAVPERPRSPVRILFCGQMIPRKGVDLLLEAFGQLVREGLDVRLVLVGREADLPAMLERVEPAARERIDYAGFQAPEALPGFFREADLFVLPSRYDGWGVVVNQAVAAGLPAICSDAVGAARDLVEPGVNGDIYPALDVERLTELLRSYAADPQRLRSASEASRARAPQLDPAHGAQQWADIVQATLGQREPVTS